MSTSQPPVEQPLTLAQIADLSDKTEQICQFCGKSFRKMNHFNRHMRQSHSDNRDHVCKEQGCNKSFKRGSHLKRHMISHTNEKKYKCNHCIMIFGYKHHLDRHIKVIHLRQRLECVLCDLKFIKKKAYNKHNAKFHNIEAERDEKEEKIGDLNCSTKMGLEQSNKADDIYNSRSQSGSEWQKNQVQSEKEMYRCQHQNCLSAFYGLYQFKRHLTRIHSQS